MKTIGITVSKIAFELGLNYVTGGEITIMRALIMGKSVKNVTDLSKLFGEAKASAKITGKLLACAIAIGIPYLT